MKTYFKQALACIALVCLLLVVIVTPVTTPVTAADDWILNNFKSSVASGLSIDSTISNGGGGGGGFNSVTTTKENVQTVTGTFDPKVQLINVRGTASWKPTIDKDVFSASVASVRVTVNDATPQVLSIPYGGSVPFDITAPVAQSAPNVKVDILMQSPGSIRSFDFPNFSGEKLELIGTLTQASGLLTARYLGSTETVKVGEETKLNAYFHIMQAAGGSSVDQSGAKVTFQIQRPDLIQPYEDTAKTDKDGIASIDYTFYVAGTYPVTFIVQGSWDDGDTLPPTTFHGSITAAEAPAAEPLRVQFVGSTTNVIATENSQLNAYFHILPAKDGDPSVSQDGAKVTFFVNGYDAGTADTNSKGEASIHYRLWDQGTFPIDYVIEKSGGNEGTLPPTTFRGSITVDSKYVVNIAPAPQAGVDAWRTAVTHGALHIGLGEVGLLAFPPVAAAVAIFGVWEVYHYINRNVSIQTRRESESGPPKFEPEEQHKDIFQWFKERWEEAQDRP